MTHDFNKPPHVNNPEDTNRKKRIPVFILIIVGIFLASLIFYMIADRDTPPVDQSIPATSSNSPNTATATANDDSSVANTTEAVAQDTATAVAKDE